MGVKLKRLLIQSHIKLQKSSLPHLTDTTLVSEPEEEMQLKGNKGSSELRRLSGPM